MRTLLEKRKFIEDHSNQVIDKFFNINPITDVSHTGPEELYLKGLTSDALYTSYADLIEPMIHLYNLGARSWCDVGCGVGRSPILWTWLFEDTKGFGIELVPERLEEARGATRGSPRNIWLESDFSSTSVALPECDIYFLYISTGPHLDLFLTKLKKLSRPSWIVVIESHGDLKPRLVWESWWLAPQSYRFPLKSHRHDPMGQVYLTKPSQLAFELELAWEGRLGLLPTDVMKHPSPMSYLLSKSSVKNWEIVIEEDSMMWTMDTLGLRWHDHQTVQGVYPTRQLRLGGMLFGLRQIPQDNPYAQWSNLRRQSSLINYSSHDEEVTNVSVRKIFINPELMLEFSDGKRVPASSIKKWEINK